VAPNSSLADAGTFGRDDIRIVTVAMDGITTDLGDPRMVNMVGLSAYVALTGAVSIASFL
jgi:Pyruvate/2-oxoacid:ferredoxin oxidoreductase gamma subunit